MAQLARGVVRKEVVVEVPSNTTQFEVPKTGAAQESSIVLFKDSSDLPKFTNVKDYFLMAENDIVLMKERGDI